MKALSNTKELFYVRSGCGQIKVEWSMACGDIKYVVACKSHPDEKVYGRFTCSRLQCPVCLDVTTKRLAKDGSDRFHGLSQRYKEQGVDLGKEKHISFSVHPSRYTKEDFERDHGKRFWADFRKLLKKIAQDGFYGGVAVLHLERKKHLNGTECRAKGCRKKHVWVYGPHVHYYGYGFFQNSVEVERETGWAYHIMANKYTRECFATLRYELTHCALFLDEDGKQVGQALRWMGILSNSKGGRKKVDTVYDYVLCKVCKMPMHKYFPADHDGVEVDWCSDHGEHEIRCDKYVYYLVKKQKLHKQMKIDELV